MTMVAKRNLLARLPGRGVGLLLHAVDQLLHADAEADIELAGFLENDVAVVAGVEFLLANLEDAGLAFAQRQQFLRGVFERLVLVIFRQQIEVRFDARLGVLEFLFDRFERVAAVGRERRVHLGGRLMAAGDDVAELVDGPRGLRRIVSGKLGGAEHGIDLGLGVHHRGAGGGDEAGLRAAQGIILLVMQGCDLQPFAGRGAEALDRVVDILDGFAERGDDGLVGAEFGDLAELSKRDLLGFLHFPGAFVERLGAARCQQAPAPGWRGWRSAPPIAGWPPGVECPVR